MAKLLKPTFGIVTTLVVTLLSSAPAFPSDTAYRCVERNGQIMFSDVPCPASASQQSVISTVPVTKGMGGHEYRQLRNMRAIRGEREPQRSVVRRTQTSGGYEQSPRTSNCPSEQDIANLETKASSITLDAKSRSFLIAEIRRARACSVEGGRYTQDDWDRINTGIANQRRINRADREIARRTAEDTHLISASPAEQQRMQADADREAMIEAASIRAEAQAEADRRRQAEQIEHGSSSRFISHCSGGSCFDNQGNRYRDAGGGQQRGPGGTLCQRMGNMVHCP